MCGQTGNICVAEKNIPQGASETAKHEHNARMQDSGVENISQLTWKEKKTYACSSAADQTYSSCAFEFLTSGNMRFFCKFYMQIKRAYIIYVF